MSGISEHGVPSTRERAGTARAAAVGPRRQAALLDQAYDAIFAWEWDGPIIVWNRGAERLYGFSAEEAVGRVSHELLQTTPPDLVERSLAALLADGQWEGELEHRRAGGQRIVTESRQVLVREPDAWHVLEANRDITERTTAEAALRFLVEAGDVLASALDVKGTLAAIADLAVPRLADWCAVHLVSEAGAVEQIAVAHVDPAKVAWARDLQERYPYEPDAPQGLPRVLRTGKPELYAEISDELLVATARDQEHLATLRQVGLTSAMLVPMSARGHVVGAISFVQAESPRRYGAADLALAEELARRAALAVDNARLYQASQATEARYRSLFEGLVDAVVVTDDQGHYLDVNQALCDLLGYTRDEVLASPVGSFSMEPAQAYALYGDIMREGALRGENVLRHKDGTPIPIEVWARRVDLPTGTVNIGVMRDITERKAMERTQQALLDSIAHDLKNPLGALRAQAQFLHRQARRIAPSPEVDRLEVGLSRIEAITARVTGQVDELQDVTRLRAGQPVDLRREPVDLVVMATQVANEYQATTDQHDIRLEMAEPSLVGFWDQRRLARVLANLLTNAIKYSPDGGAITVSVGRERADGEHVEHALLSVQDQGVGIPAADLPNVFDEFHRGANASGRIVGSGIGLAGVRQIVEQHDGAISVESDEGVGSTFTVRLPLTAEDEGQELN